MMAPKFIWKESKKEFDSLKGFSLMSYNILSPTSELIKSKIKKSWEERAEKIEHQVESFSPDILHLQECDQLDYLSIFKPNLSKRGYGCSFHKKDSLKPDGCALFFKEERYSLISQERVSLNQVVTLPFIKENQRMKKDNISVISHLHDKIAQKSLISVNSHLYWNPEFGQGFPPQKDPRKLLLTNFSGILK